MPSETRITDGAFDWAYGVDSSRSPTIRSEANPNGIPRNGLSWLVNGTVRSGGINTRTGVQPLCTVHPGLQLYQGGFMYEPLNANPYLILSIGGRLYQVRVDTDNSVVDITGAFANPATNAISYFAQGDQFLVIQAGDNATKPLFWDGAVLSRSNGITGNLTNPNINQIPAAGPMVYYMQRLWYAQGRHYSAGDIIGGPSGTAPYNNRDSILSVTENPLVIGGDGFAVPTNAGNIRAMAYPITLDQTLGQGPLFVFTPKQIYAQSVPISRTAWIAADANNQPLQQVVMNGSGAVGDRCVVSMNGDLYYQDRLPSINSFNMSLRHFGQFGNKPISNNLLRALQFNDRALMRTASGIAFQNRLYQTILPYQTDVGVAFQQIAILDLDPISTLKQDQLPAWEGTYQSTDVLQLFEGDFGGLHRAFQVIRSKIDGSIQVWEITDSNRFEDGDKRTVMRIEFPAFDGSAALGYNGLTQMKELDEARLWIDKIFGTVDFTLTYRVDQDPCEYPWFTWQECVARNTCETAQVTDPCYPTASFREGFVIPRSIPKPKSACGPTSKRLTTWGFTFQPILTVKGWARVRGIEIDAITREKPPWYARKC